MFDYRLWIALLAVLVSCCCCSVPAPKQSDGHQPIPSNESGIEGGITGSGHRPCQEQDKRKKDC